MVDEFRKYTQTEEGLDAITRVTLSYINAIEDVVDWVMAPETKFVEAGVHAAMLKHIPEKFERSPAVVNKVKQLIQVFRVTLQEDYRDALEQLAEQKRCGCGHFRHITWSGQFVIRCANCDEEEEVEIDGRAAGKFGSP